MGINVFVFEGNVGGDMEIRATPAGKVIGAFNVAMDDGWGANKKTTWVTCKMFDDRAEKIAPYVKKGMSVTVSGKLSVDEWETDGVKNKRVCCLVDAVKLPKKEESINQLPSQGQPQQNHVPKPAEGQDGFDDDIPF
jgi:single-strand DNA-binding protein